MLKPAKFCIVSMLFVGLLVVQTLLATKANAHHYKVKSGITGTITSVGSDTMSNLLSVWAEEFKSVYPQVNFQIQAAGSGTAPPAMIQGTANVGPMSRDLKSIEQQSFFQKYGYEATMIPVALDAIIVFVDLENPVSTISQKHIDAMFSITRFCGAAESLESWSQLPASGGFPHRIRMFGRSAVSGTYGLFKSRVLCDGDFKPQVAELPSSASIVQSVAFFKGAIGYAAWGFQHSGVKLLAIAPATASISEETTENANKAIHPTEDSIRNQSYPFTRTLYLMVNKPQGEALPNPVLEFIQFVYSDKGSQLTRREGYVPLDDVRKARIFSSLTR